MKGKREGERLFEIPSLCFSFSLQGVFSGWLGIAMIVWY